jgi:hypothetical protein
LRNAALFTFLLLAASLSCPGQSASASPSSQANLPWDQSAMTGCLQKAVDHYILRDEEGTVHELSGGNSKLKKLVDHQVEITGKKGIRTIDRTAPGGASTVGEIEVFEVKNVKQLAETCKLPGE